MGYDILRYTYLILLCNKTYPHFIKNEFKKKYFNNYILFFVLEKMYFQTHIKIIIKHEFFKINLSFMTHKSKIVYKIIKR